MRSSHNAAYNTLQEEYLATRDYGTLGKMYGIAREAACNYIKKYCRKKGIQLRGIDEAAHDSALYVIEKYLRKQDFRVMRISAYIYTALAVEMAIAAYRQK